MSLDDAQVGPARPVTAQQAALRELRAAINDRRLKPGQPIRQEAIAKELGVSRVPVREALKVLEAEGQLEYAPHRGFTVMKLSLEDLRELYLLRDLLEREATRLAIPRLDDVLIEQLESLVDEMEQTLPVDGGETSDGMVRYLELNETFHFLLFERSGVARLVQHIRMLWRNSDSHRSVSLNTTDSRTKAQREHRELMASYRDRDMERAARLLTVHRDTTVDHISGLIDDGAEARD